MAKAKQAGGLYYVAGVAVDANGDAVDGAPKRAKDTPTEHQPGSINSIISPEDRSSLSIANALLMASGKKPMSMNDFLKARGDASVTTVDEDEDDGKSGDSSEKLPPIANLPDHLQTLTTVREVKAMQKRDERVSAQTIYEKRLEELQG